jgi:hypothetical protein
MGVTYQKLNETDLEGNQLEVELEATFDSSYNIGGERLTVNDIAPFAPLGHIYDVTLQGSTSGGLPVSWHPLRRRIQVYQPDRPSTPGQPDGADLSGETLRLTVRGSCGE